MTDDNPRLQMAQNVSLLFNTPLGAIVLEDWRKSYDQSTFDPDPIVMAWKTGRREPYLDVLAMIAYAASPARYEPEPEEAA